MSENDNPRLRLVSDTSAADDDGPAPLRVVPPRGNVIPLRPASPPPDDPPRGAA